MEHRCAVGCIAAVNFLGYAVWKNQLIEMYDWDSEWREISPEPAVNSSTAVWSECHHSASYKTAGRDGYFILCVHRVHQVAVESFSLFQGNVITQLHRQRSAGGDLNSRLLGEKTGRSHDQRQQHGTTQRCANVDHMTLKIFYSGRAS